MNTSVSTIKTSTIKGSLKTAVVIAGTAALLSVTQAQAFQFKAGDWRGYFDTTFTASAAMRVEGTRNFGTADPTGARNLFADAGDVYASPVSLLTDFGMSKGDFGFFTRFAYVYDYTIMHKDCTNCERPNVWPYPAGGSGAPDDSIFHLGSPVPETIDGIADGAQNIAGNRFNLLDLFVYGAWDIADHPLNVRIGKQVINWGESNIQSGGISQMMNPRDLSKATTPGTDVKETLIPQESVYFNFGFTDNVSLEAYYTWNWRESTFIGAGTYFSGFDFIGPGFNPDLFIRGVEKWGNNEEPDDGGQFGINMHFIIESWNYADLGIYYVRSHAFIPHIKLVEDYAPRPDPANPGAMTLAGYEWVYPQDQDTYAISLNGEGPFETSFATELNWKPNSFDVRECRDVFGLSEVRPPGLGGAVTVGNAFGFPVDGRPTFGPGAGDPISECNGPGSRGSDLGASDVWVWLGNLTKSGGTDLFGASKLSLIMDVSMTWVPDLESRDIWDRNNVAPTSPTGQNNHIADPGHFAGAGPLDQPISDFAWGYTTVAAFEYPNLFWNLTVKPTFIFVHNVEGHSAPNTAGGLSENQRSMIYKVTFDYQAQQTLDLQYVNWLGTAGGSYDKDFVSLVYKYSF
ncbi:MAG: hypothetical protein COC20_06515 [Cellvibrionales bacterium]|nr:MAG: hypothetical protein COC20_06515 [Cellvibrionales bacterium]